MIEFTVPRLFFAFGSALRVKVKRRLNSSSINRSKISGILCITNIVCRTRQ